MEALKEILKQLPTAFGQSLMNYGIIVVVYLVVWKLLKKRLQNWRIQLKERVDAKQIKSELVNSLFTLMVSTFFVLVIYLMKSKGYTKIYTDINEYPKFFAIGGFFVFILLDDTWFYWIHRLLHHPRIFKYIHKVHHKSIDVNPFTSLSFHWAEALLLTFWIVPVSMIFPMYVPALGILQIWGFLDNINSHLGYEFFPSWWNKSFGKLMTSSTHHNMHHSKFNGNYGVHFRIWDKLLGTEFNDYEKTFDEIQDRKKAKPIITTLLLFISLTAFSQTSNSIIGNWKDQTHPEKQVQMYLGADNKIYGKSSNNTIVFKALIWDNTAKIYNGILINPDNKEEFKIKISLKNNDTFVFSVKKFIISKGFQFIRF